MSQELVPESLIVMRPLDQAPESRDRRTAVAAKLDDSTTGFMVVKGYGAAFRWAAEIFPRSVIFPALG